MPRKQIGQSYLVYRPYQISLTIHKTWAQDLHSVITKTADARCDTTIYDRFAKINTESFDGKPIHIQKAETTIYTDGSKTDYGVGAGFVIYHKNRRIHAESIHMPVKRIRFLGITTNFIV